MKGPWGELRITEIALAPPSTFLESLPCGTPGRPWFFGGMDVEQLRAVLQQTGVDPVWIQGMVAHSDCSPALGGCRVAWNPDLILSLGEEVRGRLYKVLAEFPENMEIRDPVNIRIQRKEEWFKWARLPEVAKQWMEKLYWRQGPFLSFADYPVVCAKVLEPEVRTEFLRGLTRGPALMVELLLDKQADITAIRDYWDREGKRKAFIPLLESIAQIPGGGHLDIIHLLPGVPRKLLNTFPNPEEEPIDCHWTSLNFFKAKSDDRHLRPAYNATYTQQYYRDATGEPIQYGDMIVFVTPDSDVVHSCIYLAANVVFSKNGKALWAPWKLMRLEDVAEMYLHPGDQMRVLRAKGSLPDSFE